VQSGSPVGILQLPTTKNGNAPLSRLHAHSSSVAAPNQNVEPVGRGALLDAARLRRIVGSPTTSRARDGEVFSSYRRRQSPNDKPSNDVNFEDVVSDGYWTFT